MTQDSRQATVDHIEEVRNNLAQVISDIAHRKLVHDRSKLEEPEKSGFDRATNLKGLTFGSDEYNAQLADMQDILDHHYHHPDNRHHPQHFEMGLEGMNLIDMLEMVADWVAAVKRHADGNIWDSLEYNRQRFDMNEQTYIMIANTIVYMGWG